MAAGLQETFWWWYQGNQVYFTFNDTFGSIVLYDFKQTGKKLASNNHYRLSEANLIEISCKTSVNFNRHEIKTLMVHDAREAPSEDVTLE